MFEVKSRFGLARVGKWHIEDQNKHMKTPNILFLESEDIKAPEEAEAIISEGNLSHDKPFIRSSESMFMRVGEDITKSTISPSLFYPPSQVELNTHASSLNREHLSSEIFLVCGKDEMVAHSAHEVNAEVYVLPNSLSLIRNPRSFIFTLVTLKKTVGYNKLIYTPGLGSTNHLALLTYLGVDLFDSTPLLLNARLGNYLSSLGKINKDLVSEDFCFCPSCNTDNKGYEKLLGHNYYSAISELRTARNAIKSGNLRELVESRMRSEPWMVAVLRELDIKFHTFSEKYFPVSGGKIIAASNESLFRPEIVRFRERVKQRYKKPPHPKVLLLIPCSAKKPYSFSRSHKAMERAVSQCGNRSAVHEVIITSPLGVVPRELELFYPAAQYDIPVTRSWSRDEMAMIGEDITEYLKNNSYDRIILHLPYDYMFIGDYIDEFTSTCSDGPTSHGSLRKLKEELTQAVSPYEKLNEKKKKTQALTAFARFQFGKAGESLLLNAQIKGRYPNLRILKDGEQMGMLVGERGMISLTLKGAEELVRSHAYWVDIDDFTPKGSIFAVGVLDADKGIRIGDDVAVVRDGEMIGVGVAQMSPQEMITSSKGEAVKMRHLVRSGGWDHG